MFDRDVAREIVIDKRYTNLSPIIRCLPRIRLNNIRRDKLVSNKWIVRATFALYTF